MNIDFTKAKVETLVLFIVLTFFIWSWFNHFIGIVVLGILFLIALAKWLEKIGKWPFKYHINW